MADDRPARIFVSYSRKDGAAAAADLRAWLEREGLSVWQDIVALRGGPDWWSQIEAALRSKSLDHFVLVVTPGALESRYVRQEGKAACAVEGPGLPAKGKVPRWIGHVHDLEFPEQRDRLLHVLRGPSLQKRVPMMAPEPPRDFVPRPHEFDPLKQSLLDAKGDAVAITAALRGAGGYGKTTLARALAHDADIQDAYFDGILWVELGEKPTNLIVIISDRRLRCPRRDRSHLGRGAHDRRQPGLARWRSARPLRRAGGLPGGYRHPRRDRRAPVGRLCRSRRARCR